MIARILGFLGFPKTFAGFCMGMHYCVVSPNRANRSK